MTGPLTDLEGRDNLSFDDEFNLSMISFDNCGTSGWQSPEDIWKYYFGVQESGKRQKYKFGSFQHVGSS